MHSFWKVAAVASMVLGITAVTSTLTTAYLKRMPRSESTSLAVASRPVPPAGPRTVVVEIARPLPARSAPSLRLASNEAAPGLPAPSAPPAAAADEGSKPDGAAVTPDPIVARPAAPAPPVTACDAGSRTWKIAKPGLIGGAVGAGLGAAGGAVADGGKGAGKGAIFGRLAGVALGSGYDAYHTKNECGSVLGGTTSPVADREIPVAADGRASTTSAAAPFAAEHEHVTIYSAR